MIKRTEQYEDDDGRVIANMDMAGTRWPLKTHNPNPPSPPGEQMSSSDVRRYTWNALLAALLIALVFAITWILFTLFATKIWLA